MSDSPLPRTFLPPPLEFRSVLMLRRLVLAMSFAKLLRDLLAGLVDGKIQIGVVIFRKQVRPANGETDAATKLFLRSAGMVILDDDTRVDSPAVQMLQLVDTVENVLFDPFGQFDVVRR